MKSINSLLAILFVSLLSSPSWSETLNDLVFRDGLYFNKYTDVPFVIPPFLASIKNRDYLCYCNPRLLIPMLLNISAITFVVGFIIGEDVQPPL